MKAIIALIYLRDVTLIARCWHGTSTRWVAAVLAGWYPMGKGSWHRVPLHISLWIRCLLKNYNLTSSQNIGSFALVSFFLCVYSPEGRSRLLRSPVKGHTLHPAQPGISSCSVLIYPRHEKFTISLGIQDCSPIIHSSFPPKSPDSCPKLPAHFS